jgi:hypothetical protein
VAIQLISYSNPTDFDYKGYCCNGDQVILSDRPQCSRECNTLITLCLDGYQADGDLDYCPHGKRNLSAINDQSSIVFSVPTAGDVENPVLIPFNSNNNYQPDGYRLKIGIYNELTSQLNPIDFIRIDFRIPVPFQLSGSSALNYNTIQASGNRTLAPRTK